MRQLRSADSRTSLHHFLDQGNLLGSKFPATKSMILYCGDHATPPSLLSYSKEMKQDPAKNDHPRKKVSSLSLRAIVVRGQKNAHTLFQKGYLINKQSILDIT
jgi:hypothetical protein